MSNVTTQAPTIEPLAEICVEPPDRPFILLAAPSHGGELSVGTVSALQTAAPSGKLTVEVMFPATSMLTRTFNMAWIHFLSNRRSPENPQGRYTHFAMIHNDVAAEPGWLDKLYQDLTHHDLDVLSVLIPLKNDWGLTSTAVSLPHSPHHTSMPVWPRRRLSMAEVNRLPPVFTFHDVWELLRKDGIEPYPTQDQCLLPNTGLWLAKGGEWCEDIWFHSENYIYQMGDGSWGHDENTEDWAFGRDIDHLNREGMGKVVKIGISRTVSATHIGGGGVPNQGVWGRMTHDQPVCDQYQESKREAEQEAVNGEGS